MIPTVATIVLVVLVTFVRRNREYPNSIGDWIFVVCFSGLFAASLARCSGAFASVKNVEVSRVSLVPYSVTAEHRDSPAYILDEQSVGAFNNLVSHKYTVQVKDSTGEIHEIPITRDEAYSWCEDIELAEPTLIVLETKLLYPKMAPWIIWWPTRHRCITPDPFILRAVKKN